MHIITQKRIWDAKKKHPETASALDGWYRIIKKNQFANFSELKWSFNSVDKVGNLYIFDIGGNKLRVITNIHFNRKKVYVRHVLTHKEYDKSHWKDNRGDHYESNISKSH
jgi:mRNA interferase HigB